MRFILFISVFLTLYGLLHAYAFLKVMRAFPLTRGGGAALALFMLCLLLCPVFLRVMDRWGMDSLSKAVAMAGYCWMGLLFLFVSAAAALDLYRLMATAVAHLSHGRWGLWLPTGRVLFFAALSASLVGMAYGFVEAWQIRTEQVTIRSAKIPTSPGRIRVVQVSDIHLGWMVGERRLERILARVREARPDVLISTGDLVDGQMDDCSRLAEMFQGVHAPRGKFAVMGNHEFYAGIGRSVEFTRAAGFETLRGRWVEVGGSLVIAGVDDEAGKVYGLLEGDAEEDLLTRVPDDRFAILLKHRPHVTPTAGRGWDLQLSGHTHGGQIFPFSLLIHMLYPVDQGLAKGNGGALLYVSRGSGTWGPPVRLLAPPEITVIDLIHSPVPE